MPERRRRRDADQLVAVGRGRAARRAGVVRGGVDRVRRLARELERPAVQPRRRGGARAARARNGAGQRCWWRSIVMRLKRFTEPIH